MRRTRPPARPFAPAWHDFGYCLIALAIGVRVLFGSFSLPELALDSRAADLAARVQVLSVLCSDLPRPAPPHHPGHAPQPLDEAMLLAEALEAPLVPEAGVVLPSSEAASAVEPFIRPEIRGPPLLRWRRPSPRAPPILI